jgi:hypothetical protein
MKKQWRAYFWREDRHDYEESLPIDKFTAKQLLNQDSECHYIRKVEGWFQRQIEKPDHEMLHTSVIDGDVNNQDTVKKSCHCRSH